MVADSKRSFGWLSPIGWAEELRPLRDPQPWALIPIMALVSVIKGTDIVRESSLLARMELAPSRDPDWGTWALFVLLGLAAAVAGAAAFQRRDIEYE